MDIFDVNPITPNARFISKSVDIVRNGGLIIYPTDVNYGLGCLLSSANGVRALNALTKDLGRNKLHTIICRDFSEISKYARLDNDTFRLLKKILPGAYTIILEATSLVPKVCHTRRSTIGVRMMQNSVIQAMFAHIDSPLLNFTALPYDDSRLMDDPMDIQEIYSSSVSALINVGSVPCRQTTVLDLSGVERVVVRQGEGKTDLIV